MLKDYNFNNSLGGFSFVVFVLFVVVLAICFFVISRTDSWIANTIHPKIPIMIIFVSSMCREIRADIHDYDVVKEQLAVYFIFRHLNGECYDLDEAVYFSLFSVRAIMCIARAYYGENPTISEISDTARMYSAEIEYSDCNIEEIIEKISVG